MMEERLIVRLQADSEQIEWVLQNAQGIMGSPKVGTFADIKLPGFKGKMTLLAPTTLVYLTKAKLPKLSESKLRKAVPFVIEDELAATIEDSHFAYSPGRYAGKAVIGVVQRAHMEEWLGKMPSEIKTHLVAMVPDVLAIPHEPNKWTIANFGDTALVRTNEVMGFAVDKAFLPTVLAQYLQEEGREVPQEMNKTFQRIN